MLWRDFLIRYLEVLVFSVSVEIYLNSVPIGFCVFAYTCVLLFVIRLYSTLNSFLLKHLLQAFNQNDLVENK